MQSRHREQMCDPNTGKRLALRGGEPAPIAQSESAQQGAPFAELFESFAGLSSHPPQTGEPARALALG